MNDSDDKEVHLGAARPDWLAGVANEAAAFALFAGEEKITVFDARQKYLPLAEHDGGWSTNLSESMSGSGPVMVTRTGRIHRFGSLISRPRSYSGSHRVFVRDGGVLRLASSLSRATGLSSTTAPVRARVGGRHAPTSQECSSSVVRATTECCRRPWRRRPSSDRDVSAGAASMVSISGRSTGASWL